MEDKLLAAIKECEELPDSAKQKIHNKYYALVHTRVQIFRKHLGSDGKIETIILDQDDQNPVLCLEGLPASSGGTFSYVEFWVYQFSHLANRRGQCMAA